MEYIFSNYGIEIVVGMIISVLVFIFLRVLYFGYIKKESKNQNRILKLLYLNPKIPNPIQNWLGIKLLSFLHLLNNTINRGSTFTNLETILS